MVLVSEEMLSKQISVCAGRTIKSKEVRFPLSIMQG